MKFGKVPDPQHIDFTMPPDHPDTRLVFEKYQHTEPLKVHIGCAKWNRQDLRGFYPRGTKDELFYYASQFNSIELNATFYRFFPVEQFQKWYDRTTDDFKFFPKIAQHISHFKRLNEVEDLVENYLYAVSNLKEKLGTIFLQMHDNFSPKDFEKVIKFIEFWPEEIPMAIELRHTDWHNDPRISDELYHLMEENNIANILVDTAGRRDLMHMCLTNNEAFIRFVGANHESDYTRLDDWVSRLKEWNNSGLKKIHFFVHQNIEEASPLLSAYFITKLNAALGTNLKVPVMGNDQNLFSLKNLL